MKDRETKIDFKIGAQVYWLVGDTKTEGQIQDIKDSTKASGLAVRKDRESDRVLTIRLKDGRIVMKLESDVILVKER